MKLRWGFVFAALVVAAGCAQRDFNSQSGAASTDASGWSHVVPLKSPEGLALQIDFKTYRHHSEGCYSCPEFLMAAPLWFNVSGDMLKPTSKVSVVLVNFRHPPEYVNIPVEQKNSVAVELKWDETAKKFTGDTAPIAIWDSGTGGTYTYTQEAAVVVDGTWYKHGKDENFKFDMKKSM